MAQIITFNTLAARDPRDVGGAMEFPTLNTTKSEMIQ
jgi:hypothetical protein